MVELTIRGQLFIIIPAFVAFMVLMINYRNITKDKKSVLNLVAWVLRLCVVMITIFILADPYVHFTRSREKLPDVSLFIDTSSSMAYNTGKLSEPVIQSLKELTNWLGERSHRLSLFEFNSSVQQIDAVQDISFTHPLTDYSTIPSVINSEGSRINFILTDGIATAGPDPSAIKFRQNQMIHVIAAENKAAWKDISIEKMDYPATVIQGDSITINTSIRIQSAEEVNTELRILDKTGKVISSVQVKMNPGNGITELSVPVIVRRDQVPETVFVVPVDGENNIRNNKFTLQLTVLSENEHILLVTGALSPNTSLIKKILKSIPRADIDHFFRIAGTVWNRPVSDILDEAPKLIILDNFPILNNDRKLFDKLIRVSKDKGTSVVFFEGANSGIQTTALISQLAKISSEQVRVNSPLTVSVTDLGGRYFNRRGAENFPPVNIIHQWKTGSAQQDMLTFSDGSAAILKTELPFPFFGVFIPELSKLNFKLGQTNSPDILSDGLKNIFLSSIYSKNDLITTRLEKGSYDMGEVINITGLYNEDYIDKPARMSFSLQNGDGEVLQEIPAEYNVDSNEFKGSFLANNSGAFNIITHSVWDDGNEFTSPAHDIIVQNISTEDRNLQVNRNSLLELSSRNGGKLFDFDNLTKLYNSLEFSPEKKTETYKFSAITTYTWWWVIIILLSAEWFIRKRIGLL